MEKIVEERRIKPSGVVIYTRDGRLFETGLERFMSREAIERAHELEGISAVVWLPWNGREALIERE